MPDYTVIKVGLDTSGRDLYFTRYAWSVWQAVLATPEVAPFAHKVVVVQGGFMTLNGGGADASAGYHDRAKCWDIRTWNLTVLELNILIRALRKAAIAAWRRDLTALHGGMDPHCHVTFGADRPGSPGAEASWRGYLNNENGLANGAPDYEWRPSPLVTKPPASLLEEDDMADAKTQAQLDRIEKLAKDTNSDLATFRTNEQRRDKAAAEKAKASKAALVEALGGLADQLTELANDTTADSATLRSKIHTAQTRLLKALADDPDVDGVDNPAQEA